MQGVERPQPTSAGADHGGREPCSRRVVRSSTPRFMPMSWPADDGASAWFAAPRDLGSLRSPACGVGSDGVLDHDRARSSYAVRRRRVPARRGGRRTSRTAWFAPTRCFSEERDEVVGDLGLGLRSTRVSATASRTSRPSASARWRRSWRPRAQASTSDASWRFRRPKPEASRARGRRRHGGWLCPASPS